MNIVRRHLSAIKGGRLAAAAYPAKVVSLLISDVPGDDPAAIGSGPTVLDPTTFADARTVLDRFRIEPPVAVRRHLRAARDETPKPGDPRLAHVENVIIATPQRSWKRRQRSPETRESHRCSWATHSRGEAAELGKAMAGIARSNHGCPLPPPCVLLSGGEATVTVRGRGRGGRNVEFLLALAVALDGLQGESALAADTDGIDGAADAAGAIVTADTLARAAELGFDARAMLAANDGIAFSRRLATK